MISSNYEVLSKFFEDYNVVPTWINCNYTWGSLDPGTGHWTGAVGQVFGIVQNKY